MTRLRTALVLALTGTLAGTALVAGSAAALAPAQAAPAAPAAAAADPFYDPPATLPAANGTLVRTAPQRLGVSLVLPGQTAPLPATGTKIMYKSTDENGGRVAVTGVYLEPSSAWTGRGPRPLVSFAEGTQGQGDGCAPSKSLESPLRVEPGQTALGYELPSIYAFLNKGIAVVVTDYVGLGTTDRVHTYINRLDLGRSVLDAARAAKQVPGATVTSASPIGLYGYSQGGGATGAAAELAATYAPELPVKGAYVGAPPANPRKVLDSIDGTALTGAIGYAINGLVSYRPALRAALDAEVNAAGRAALDTVSRQCVADSLLSYGFARTTSWTTSGQSAGQVVDRIPAAVAAVEAQKLGKVKPTIPTMVLTGTLDDAVDHGQARQLAVDWCARGAKVTYTPVVQLVPTGGTVLNHLGPAFTRGPQAQSWLIDRLNGVPASSNCGLVPFLP